MSEIRHIATERDGSRLDAAYEGLLAAAGTTGFGARVREAVEAVSAGARRTYLYEATSIRETDLRFCDCEPEVRAMLPAYSSRYLHRDPVADAYQAASRRGDLVLQRVRPSEVACDGLRRMFFEDQGIVERISIVRRGASAWQAINLARHASVGSFSDREIDRVVALARLALPMLVLNRPTAPTVDELERRFERFAGLTGREQQVCARAALGMSVEATALELGIARTTVLTLRRRAYGRLAVTSAIELRALVTS